MPTFRSDDGLEIFYESWGDSDGVPVVLHHGFAASGQIDWVQTGVIEALTAAGRRVTALDARGHGRSDKPHDPARFGEARIPLASLSVPTLVLVGRDDSLATRPETLAAAIPGAQLRVIDGDHGGALHEPAFRKAIVDFLAEA